MFTITPETCANLSDREWYSLINTAEKRLTEEWINLRLGIKIGDIVPVTEGSNSMMKVTGIWASLDRGKYWVFLSGKNILKGTTKIGKRQANGHRIMEPR